MRHETITLKDARVQRLSLLLLPLFTGVLLFWPRLFPLDDAYITLSNARVFLSGSPDPNYVGSSYLTGATSPVHLLLVAMLGLVVTPIWASLLLSLGGGALYLMGLQRIVDRAGVTGWRQAAVLFVAALSGFTFIHYLNGLETSLAMAASAWMLVWCDDRRRLPILAGIVPFLRPELGLLSVFLIGRLSIRSGFTSAAKMVAVAAIAASPWLLWIWIQTGAILPSTMAAKLAWFHPLETSLSTKLIGTTYILAVTYQLPIYLGLLGLWKARAGKVAGVFVLCGLGTAAVIMPGLVEWNYGRYTAIYLPILAAGLANLAAERSKASDILIGLLTAWAAVTAALSARTYEREIGYARLVQDHARFVAKLPASSVVLIHDAGQVAWEAPKARLVDVVGLKTPAVVPIHQRLTTGDCQRSRALDSIAHNYSATHLVAMNRWTWPCVSENLQDAGWRLRPVYQDLYTVYELRSPRTR